ncbi:MAG: hypothetical protein LBB98_13780, partial [Treponema sp.]|nr:hypothetical protein [Treponema sp.]
MDKTRTPFLINNLALKLSRRKAGSWVWTRLPVTGLNRSYPATAPGTYDRKKEAGKPGTKSRRASRPEGKRGGRPVKYGEGFVKALSAIWDEFGKPCGKLPVPMI